MTTLKLSALQLLSINLVLFLCAGCDRPETRTDPSAPASKEPVSETTTSSRSVEKAPVKPAAKQVDEEVDISKEPEAPEFYVYVTDGKMMIEGALRSRFQIEEIGSALESFFSDLEVVNSLKRERHRIAVGWANRIPAALLYDYFSIVQNPSVKYSDGVVTLAGTVKNKRDLREVSEMAINAFSGTNTRDLVNEIKIAE